MNDFYTAGEILVWDRVDTIAAENMIYAFKCLGWGVCAKAQIGLSVFYTVDLTLGHPVRPELVKLTANRLPDRTY